MADLQKKDRCMSTIVRISVLSWSAALLTASYAGLLAKMDPTFIATVFTAAAATFGVDTLKKDDKDKDDAKPDSVPATTAVEPTPVPVEPIFDPTPVAAAEPVAVAESSGEDPGPSRYADTEA